MKLLYAVAKALRCEPPCCGRPASDSVRKPDAGKLHVRFDERDLETERFALPRQISTLLRREKGALIQWEEDIPPGNCCSSRKQSGRGPLVTAEHEASDVKGPAVVGSAST